MWHLRDTSTKKSFDIYLTLKLTECLIFYLATLLMSEVEGIHPYLQNDFRDKKGSSNETLSQPAAWNPLTCNQSSSLPS